MTWAQGALATGIGFFLGTVTVGCFAIADTVSAEQPAAARASSGPTSASAKATDEPTSGKSKAIAEAEPPPEPADTAPEEAPIGNAVIPTERPEDWLRQGRRRCHRYGNRRFCDGPLKVPEPQGEAAKRAERLGLGVFKTASWLLGRPPKDEWVEAVDGREADSLRWPVDGGNFWRGYGRGRHAGRDKFHKGVDIGCEPGTPVVSVNDGIVAYSHFEVRGYGNLVLVVHADASVSLYAHLKSAYVFPGQRVRRGQVLGESGHTGLARGPHLHFEWRVEGRPKDPLERFEGLPEQAEQRLARLEERRAARRERIRRRREYRRRLREHERKRAEMRRRRERREVGER